LQFFPVSGERRQAHQQHYRGAVTHKLLSTP
jgi:hypothetical protein